MEIQLVSIALGIHFGKLCLVMNTLLFWVVEYVADNLFVCVLIMLL